MEQFITQEKYNEIEDLVDKIVSVTTKADAQYYIKQLESSTSNLCGTVNLIMSQLKSTVRTAAGGVSNKYEKVNYCYDELSKLSPWIKG